MIAEDLPSAAPREAVAALWAIRPPVLGYLFYAQEFVWLRDVMVLLLI
jgi:hypothetical protein